MVFVPQGIPDTDHLLSHKPEFFVKSSVVREIVPLQVAEGFALLSPELVESKEVAEAAENHVY